MRHAKSCGRVALALIGLVGFACGDNAGGGNNPPPPGSAELTALAITPPTVTLTVGTSQMLNVTGTFDDGSVQRVASGLTFTSSKPDSVKMDANLAQALAPGSSTITVSKDGVTGTAEVTVVAEETGVVVFTDQFAPGLSFAPFNPAHTDVQVDTAEFHSGAASLAFKVPAVEYAGGAFKLATPVDLSSYNALTFWAKSSKSALLNVVGIGNDAGASRFQAEWNAVPLNVEWTRYVMPLPLPGKLTAETGLFHLAEGADEGAYTIWLDDIRYETVDAAALGTPAPAIATEAVTKQVGDAFMINGASVTYMIDGAARTIAASRRYFTFASSDPLVATVDEAGQVTGIGVGSAIITAKLGAIDAVGALTVAVGAVTVPTEPAPTPTAAAADVIALFSDAYTAVAVDTWRTDWSDATLTDVDIGTDHVKKYSNLAYAGVEFFRTAPVDASAMTHFHLDVWIPDVTTFKVKLVDFGADGAFGGGDDVEHELTFDGASTPAMVAGAWVGLDIPLASFTNLTTRAHLSQLIVSSSSRATVYVDNVYFHQLPVAP